MLYCVAVSQTIQRSCCDTINGAAAYLLPPTNCQRAGLGQRREQRPMRARVQLQKITRRVFSCQRSRVVGVRQVLQRIQCSHVKRDNACARCTR